MASAKITSKNDSSNDSESIMLVKITTVKATQTASLTVRAAVIVTGNNNLDIIDSYFTT